MHKQLWNAMRLEIEIEPREPLLVKSGTFSPNPALPDMQFVRTMTSDGERIFIPGSSLKGVFRSFSEKVLRTARSDWACDPFLNSSCGKKLEKEVDTARIYRESCYACKIYGNTRLKGRLSFTDALPDGEVKTETRYGVAISRLSNATAAGPFEIEVLIQGKLKSSMALQNFEVWQLGLLSVTLQALNEGLVKIGYGKNRGFGEVSGAIVGAVVEHAKQLGIDGKDILGAGAFASDEDRERYGLGPNDRLLQLPEPSQERDLGVLIRRTYTGEQWKLIAERAIGALAQLAERKQ